MTDKNSERIRAELAAQFQLGAGSLHGPTHWAAVEAHAVRLAEASGGDVAVCRWFAVFHDAARLDEGYDSGHGERGAALVLHYRPRLPLIETQIELLVEACRVHERGFVSPDPTIGACWDADRLDLVRVGMTPRAKYMSTLAGKEAARARGAWMAGMPKP